MNHSDDLNPTRACPVCASPASDATRIGYGKGEWQLVRCHCCSMVYLPNPPSYGELEDDFAWHTTYSNERARRREGRRLYYMVSDTAKAVRRALSGGGPGHKAGQLLKRFAGRGRVLDVGCGSGVTINAIPSDLVPYGVEIAPYLARKSDAVCQPRGGKVVVAPALEGIAKFEPAFFDGVLMHSYLEHETQPGLVVEAAARVLRPEGALVIKVPNFDSFNRRIRGADWPGFRHPDHVNYFTPTTLVRLCAQTGLFAQRAAFFSHPPFSDNMWLIVRRTKD